MSATDPLATLNPSIVGQAEKAHTAILHRVLSGTTLDEQQWITLQLAVGSTGELDRASLVNKVSNAAKYAPPAVEAAIASLVDASLLESFPRDPNSLAVTAQGRDLVAALRTKVAEYIGEAYGSIPADDLATAARVLGAITAKLSEVLARSAA